MDCYYHGYSGGPGGPCEQCESTNGENAGYYKAAAEREKLRQESKPKTA